MEWLNGPELDKLCSLETLMSIDRDLRKMGNASDGAPEFQTKVLTPRPRIQIILDLHSFELGRPCRGEMKGFIFRTLRKFSSCFYFNSCSSFMLAALRAV